MSDIKWMACRSWQLKATKEEAVADLEAWLTKSGSVSKRNQFNIFPVFVGDLDSLSAQEPLNVGDKVRIVLPPHNAFSNFPTTFGDSFSSDMFHIAICQPEKIATVERILENDGRKKFRLGTVGYNWPREALEKI